MSKDEKFENSNKKKKDYYSFDPTGLERAAKAAKTLDESKNAKSAYELTMKEEHTNFMKEKRLCK